MLTITLPEEEFFDEAKNEFVTFDSIELRLEHSLVSLSKWESEHEKPFLDREEKTQEETLDYIRCMIFSPEDFPKNITDRLKSEHYELINTYLEKKMTATWFSDESKPRREIITSEVIYYWMISFNIPIQCEHWHLNRLLTLIKVCNEKNQPPKKQRKADIMRKYRELNAQRREQLGTRG